MFDYVLKHALMQFPAWGISDFLRLPVCLDIHFAWQIFCSNYESRYCQLGLLVFKSSRLCVPSIFKRYDTATLLSIWTWIVKFDRFFMKVRIANFTARNSKTFMWCQCSCFNHFPPVEIPLQCAPHLLEEAFVWMVIWGSSCWFFFAIG